MRIQGYVTAIAIVLVTFLGVSAQSNTFTYQGKLTDGGAAANGTYLMQFSLWDSVTGGNQIGQTLSFEGGLSNGPAIQVNNGIFTVQLDFGSPTPPGDTTPRFDGSPRWIAIAVRKVGELTYTPLNPRQPITSSPYSIKSASATNSDNATNSTTAGNALSLGGVAASQYVVTTDARLSDARTPTAGSTNYIQNGTSTQASSNFNISGNGTVGGSLTANSLSGNGSGITALSAGNISTGTLAVARGGTGVTSSGASGSFLRSNGVGWTSSQLSVSDIPSGSSFYIQNSVLSQAGNFNVSGNGTVGGTMTAGNVNVNSFLSVSGNAALTGRVAVGTNPTTFMFQVVDPLNSGLRVQTNTGGGRVASFGGNGNFEIDSPGSNGGRLIITEAGDVSIGLGNTALGNLFVKGDVTGNGRGDFTGDVAGANARFSSVRISGLGSGGFLPLCADGSNFLAFCVSSRRFKKNIVPFGGGLSLVEKLRPVAFDWRQNGLHDLGLIAEEVAKVEPLLVTRDKKGEIMGVKYDRVGVAAINAIKEQQEEIEKLQEQVLELTRSVRRQRHRPTVRRSLRYRHQ